MRIISASSSLPVHRWRGMLWGMNLPSIEELQSGDSEAWDVAFDWLWPKAYNIANKILTPLAPSDTEDVVIEAFTSLFEQIHTVRGTESLPSLFVAMASNRARSHLRKLNTKKRSSLKSIPMDSALEEELPICEANPMEMMETAELFQLLEQIRLELPRKSAKYIHEHYTLGLTHKMISERYGVAISTVSINIRRGLRILREQLEKNQIFCDSLHSRMRIR